MFWSYWLNSPTLSISIHLPNYLKFCHLKRNKKTNKHQYLFVLPKNVLTLWLSKKQINSKNWTFPVTERPRQANIWVPGQLSILSEFLDSKDYKKNTLSQKKKWKKWEGEEGGEEEGGKKRILTTKNELSNFTQFEILSINTK